MFLRLFLILIVGCALIFGSYVPTPEQVNNTIINNLPNGERIVVANRGGGDGLIIQTVDGDAQISLILDDDSQPMYITWSILTNEIYIGDRSNNQLFIYDTLHYRRSDPIPIECNGIFHKSINFKNQLWIVCDQDKKILIMDVETKQVITTIHIVTSNCYIPHDIYSSTLYGFVTLKHIDNTVNTGFIVQYSTETFDEIGRLEIGGDPHLSNDYWGAQPEWLFASSQVAGKAYKINVAASALSIVATVDVANAHAIMATLDLVGVVDITSVDGIGSIHLFDTTTFTPITIVDTIEGHPHNLMSDWLLTKIYITHSDTDKISAYDIDFTYPNILKNGRIIYDKPGSVPFGIMGVVDDGCN